MGQQPKEPLDGESLVHWLDSASSARTGGDVFIDWNGSNTDIITGTGNDRIQKPFKKRSSDAEVNAALADPVRTIITNDGWKYNWSPAGESELYHLGKDPGEKDNLVEEPEYVTFINELQDKIVKWQEEKGDRL